MSDFIWKEDYTVNNPVLDGHHKHLFDLFNLLKVQLFKSNNQQEVTNIIKELKEYTIYHFKAEEDLMKDAGFEGLAEHVTKHNDFIHKLNDIETKSSDVITEELFIYLNQWLVSHIQNVDQNYKNHI